METPQKKEEWNYTLTVFRNAETPQNFAETSQKRKHLN